MKLFKTDAFPVLESDRGLTFLPDDDWNQLITREDLPEYLRELSQLRVDLPPGDPQRPAPHRDGNLLAPIGEQEVWAAGVTYFRSRDARMEESKSAGGGDFYNRVYSAERPELFFKATPHRVAAPGGKVAIRRDSAWNVPEPEWTLLISPGGRITGYTIGNDMSSRDIEGENPLYLPQAKVYARSCALGPCILIAEGAFEPATEIRMEILRQGKAEFTGSTTLASLKRRPEELVDYLFRDNYFPNGCFLLTGTGIVPPDSFTLQPGDEIRITIPAIGTLANEVDFAGA